MEALTLYELNRRVRGVLEQALPDDCWLQAELSEVRTNAAGHCYMEFVQKDARSNALVAKARGVVWSNVFRLLRPYFERETGQPFAAGIKVMVQVRVEFHELYGYSLSVTDIDPTYTVGDMVRRRREILRQLEEEGVLTLNKELPMPQVPGRIAVISSATAAGYGDFCNQLSGNPDGFRFVTRLFPAVMQGDRVESSILEALDSIVSSGEEWDVVVIIRGGGAVSDLACFDTYLLAAACAQFPIPIVTGIGHERDDTVVDMVAHTRVKTPTAVAGLLVERMRGAGRRIDEAAAAIHYHVCRYLETEKRRLSDIVRRLPDLQALCRMREERHIDLLWQRARMAARNRLYDCRHQLQLIGQRIDGCDVQRLLARGFTLTLKDGRALTDASCVKPGESIVTRLAQGEVVSIVKETNV